MPFEPTRARPTRFPSPHLAVPDCLLVAGAAAVVEWRHSAHRAGRWQLRLAACAHLAGRGTTVLGGSSSCLAGVNPRRSDGRNGGIRQETRPELRPLRGLPSQSVAATSYARRVRVTVYDATGFEDRSRPLVAFPSVEVDVQPRWSVAQVLQGRLRNPASGGVAREGGA
jgi:hypothetical protein